MLLGSSVGNPWHFGADPDLDLWLKDPNPAPDPTPDPTLSLVTFFFFLLTRRHIIFSFDHFNFLQKYCVKILVSKHYFSPRPTLKEKGKIRIRIRTSDKWIWIQEVQKTSGSCRCRSPKLLGSKLGLLMQNRPWAVGFCPHSQIPFGENGTIPRWHNLTNSTP